MKMKLLDYTLITLLAGMASSATNAQEAPPAAKAGGDAAPAVDCSGAQCASAG